MSVGETKVHLTSQDIPKEIPANVMMMEDLLHAILSFKPGHYDVKHLSDIKKDLFTTLKKNMFNTDMEHGVTKRRVVSMPLVKQLPRVPQMNDVTSNNHDNDTKKTSSSLFDAIYKNYQPQYQYKSPSGPQVDSNDNRTTIDSNMNQSNNFDQPSVESKIQFPLDLKTNTIQSSLQSKTNTMQSFLESKTNTMKSSLESNTYKSQPLSEAKTGKGQNSLLNIAEKFQKFNKDTISNPKARVASAPTLVNRTPTVTVIAQPPKVEQNQQNHSQNLSSHSKSKVSRISFIKKAFHRYSIQFENPISIVKSKGSHKINKPLGRSNSGSSILKPILKPHYNQNPIDNHRNKRYTIHTELPITIDDFSSFSVDSFFKSLNNYDDITEDTAVSSIDNLPKELLLLNAQTHLKSALSRKKNVNNTQHVRLKSVKFDEKHSIYSAKNFTASSIMQDHIFNPISNQADDISDGSSIYSNDEPEVPVILSGDRKPSSKSIGKLPKEETHKKAKSYYEDVYTSLTSGFKGGTRRHSVHEENPISREHDELDKPKNIPTEEDNKDNLLYNAIDDILSDYSRIPFNKKRGDGSSDEPTSQEEEEEDKEERILAIELVKSTAQNQDHESADGHQNFLQNNQFYDLKSNSIMRTKSHSEKVKRTLSLGRPQLYYSNSVTSSQISSQSYLEYYQQYNGTYSRPLPEIQFSDVDSNKFKHTGRNTLHDIEKHLVPSIRSNSASIDNDRNSIFSNGTHNKSSESSFDAQQCINWKGEKTKMLHEQASGSYPEHSYDLPRFNSLHDPAEFINDNNSPGKVIPSPNIDSDSKLMINMKKLRNKRSASMSSKSNRYKSKETGLNSSTSIKDCKKNLKEYIKQRPFSYCLDDSKAYDTNRYMYFNSTGTPRKVSNTTKSSGNSNPNRDLESDSALLTDFTGNHANKYYNGGNEHEGNFENTAKDSRLALPYFKSLRHLDNLESASVLANIPKLEETKEEEMRNKEIDIRMLKGNHKYVQLEQGLNRRIANDFEHLESHNNSAQADDIDKIKEQATPENKNLEQNTKNRNLEAHQVTNLFLKVEENTTKDLYELNNPRDKLIRYNLPVKAGVSEIPEFKYNEQDYPILTSIDDLHYGDAMQSQQTPSANRKFINNNVENEQIQYNTIDYQCDANFQPYQQHQSYQPEYVNCLKSCYENQAPSMFIKETPQAFRSQFQGKYNQLYQYRKESDGGYKTDYHLKQNFISQQREQQSNKQTTYNSNDKIEKDLVKFDDQYQTPKKPLPKAPLSQHSNTTSLPLGAKSCSDLLQVMSKDYPTNSYLEPDYIVKSKFKQAHEMNNELSSKLLFKRFISGGYTSFYKESKIDKSRRSISASDYQSKRLPQMVANKPLPNKPQKQYQQGHEIRGHSHQLYDCHYNPPLTDTRVTLIQDENDFEPFPSVEINDHIPKVKKCSTKLDYHIPSLKEQREDYNTLPILSVSYH